MSPNRVGRLRRTRYVNGGLFAKPAEVGLQRQEIDAAAAGDHPDWRKVEPAHLRVPDRGRPRARPAVGAGAHYTHEVDIQKIVEPDHRPALAGADGCRHHAAVRRQTSQNELPDFRGARSGMRLRETSSTSPTASCARLEHELTERTTGSPPDRATDPTRRPSVLSPAQPPGHRYRAVLGPAGPGDAVDGSQLDVESARPGRTTLPLQDLSTIVQADALRTPWPETDCIVGQSPVLGDRNIRGQYGDDYVEWLKGHFAVGVKDFCTYWFRLAADHLRPGQRAGLVGTNSISQNRARSASLEYVESRGGVITDAVSSQKWPGRGQGPRQHRELGGRAGCASRSVHARRNRSARHQRQPALCHVGRVDATTTTRECRPRVLRPCSDRQGFSDHRRRRRFDAFGSRCRL